MIRVRQWRGLVSNYTLTTRAPLRVAYRLCPPEIAAVGLYYAAVVRSLLLKLVADDETL